MTAISEYRALTEAERRALAALKFDLAPTPDDVWRPSPFNVPDLHREVVESIFDGVGQARAADDSSPLGVVVQGPAGSGKTHLLGMVRSRTQHDGGYFFLVSLLSGTQFWESTALCIADGLLRESVGWSTQLKAFLRRLSATLGLPPRLRDAVAGDAALKPGDLTAFIGALRDKDRALGQETQHTARALVLYGAQDHTLQDLGYAFLTSLGLADFEERAEWGMAVEPRPAALIVRDISRLLALTGSPTVIAYDQLDTLFAQSGGSAITSGGAIDEASAAMIGQVANGLMSLREVTRKALIVVACIPDTWKILRREAVGPVPDRFREAPFLGRVSNARVGMAIVRKRLEGRYGDVGFRPPYPTWPIRELAFAEAAHFTPRALLKRVERHAVACLRRDVVAELENLEDDGPLTFVELPAVRSEGSSFEELDARFASLVRQADVAEALHRYTEDARVPELLSAGLSALIVELGDPAFKYDPVPSHRPPLHARLRRTLDEGTDDEQHWAFRAISSGHPGAVMSRVNAASTVAGLDEAVPKRRLFLLRNNKWPSGPKTTETVNRFHARGGQTLPLDEADLSVFEALRVMQAERDGRLAAWLADRRPASSTALFRTALRLDGAPQVPAQAGPSRQAGSDRESSPERLPSPPAPSVPPAGCVRIGVAVDSGEPYDLDLATFADHTVVVAERGRTPLLRRLVEECALRGVSAVVLDWSNEFVRLGEPWPARPVRWGPGDDAASRELLAGTEVVVWTPGLDSGRPLFFPPLPDFSEPGERRVAVDMAVGALEPWATVDSSSTATLHDALTRFAQAPDGGLPALVALLAGTPEGTALAEAMAADPLLGGGMPVDPGILFTPQPHKRARVCVISMAGLGAPRRQQTFVSHLQMAVHAWLRRQPDSRPLRGLLVLDEAHTLAPAQGSTAGTASMLGLVAKARAHGLGLVFGVPEEGALHPHLLAATATHLREVSPDGVFDVTAPGRHAERVATPMCLTHHPGAPLPSAEVIAWANTYPGR